MEELFTAEDAESAEVGKEIRDKKAGAKILKNVYPVSFSLS